MTDDLATDGYVDWEVPTQAEHEHSVLAELLGRMKRDGLITQRKGCDPELRSYGKQVLAVLETIRDHDGG